MEDIINNLYKQITKTLPQADRKVFDTMFAQRMTLFSPAELLKGLPLHKKLVVIRDAIAELDARKCSDTPLFTPLVNVTITALIAASKLEFPRKGRLPKSANADLQKPVECSQSTTDDSEKAVSATKATDTKPKSRSKSPKLVKETKPIRKPSEAKRKEIYDMILATGENGPHPYEIVPYIKCKDGKCSFCRSLYYNIAITPCVGHSKCNKFGWFPHVGIGLWTRLAKLHSQKTTFEPRDHELKGNELPSYANYYKMNPDVFTYTPQNSPGPLEDFGNPESPMSEDSSVRPSRVKRNRSCSSSSSESHDTWADEVEGEKAIEKANALLMDDDSSTL